ncbi:MAG: winged helix-turn-helix transcriptional regulator [Arenicellaceae bacterium]|nr:winged helix-turn-helix transcriptional regulator [Arenicellaceae bacterium]
MNGTSKKDRLMLDLLGAIEQQNDLSQRSMAKQLGVALGLTNSYLKLCIRRGFIKVTTASANQYLYYLTPKGFAEKARLTTDFLSTSFTLFRQAGDWYVELYHQAISQGHRSIVLAGLSDLTELAYLKSLNCEIEVVGVYDPTIELIEYFGLPVWKQSSEVPQNSMVLVTALRGAEEMSDMCREDFGVDRVMVPSFVTGLSFRQEDEVVINEKS